MFASASDIKKLSNNKSNTGVGSGSPKTLLTGIGLKSNQKSKILLPKLEEKAIKNSTVVKRKDSLGSKKNNPKSEISHSHINDSKNNDIDEGSLIFDLNSKTGKNIKKDKDKGKEKDSTASLSHVAATKRLSINSNSRTQTKRTNYANKPILTAIEKIFEVENVRNKITEEYAKITLKNYFRGKKSIITKWRTTLELLQNLDAKLFLQALKCLGDIYVEFDEFETAKHFYFYYKFFANYMELLDEVMIAYESLGNVYKFLFQYHKAIKCYKKQIEISWVLNNKVSELRAYDNIGIQYFYLGNKDKAKYYHERMLYGRSENMKSEARVAVSKNYRNKNFHMFNEDKYVKYNRNNDELKDKLRESLALFEDNKFVDLENVDILKNQDNMKNSFISEVDMTFSIIPEKYLREESYLPEMPKLKSLTTRSLNKETRAKTNKVKKVGEGGFRQTNNIVENMILSHLSTKRKEFNSDRFRKVFENFDMTLFEVKDNLKQIALN